MIFLMISIYKDWSIRWRLYSAQSKRTPRTPHADFSVVALQNAQDFFEKQGVFMMSLIEKTFTDSNGVSHTVTVPRAAETEMWPMGTHAWVRDIALGADRVLQVAHTENNEELQIHGKELLLSALTLLSTKSQLARFVAGIQEHSFVYLQNTEHWPQIFLGIESNLSGEIYEPWAHKQDAWQILAIATFQALERHQILPTDLTDGQQRFLAYSAPFLVAAEYWRQPNSGSWEELEAVRSSVLSCDTTLLYEYTKYLALPESDWLQSLTKEWWEFIPKDAQRESIEDYLQTAYKKGIEVLQAQLPYESPQYAKVDPQYREADAALLYILHNNSLEQIAHVYGKSQDWIHEQENALLEQVYSLQCKKSGGIARYKNDSYQRIGFFRPSVVKKLRKYYGSQSGEASGVQDFLQREAVVPKGKEALWTHFVWQLSWWASAKFIQTREARYKKIAEQQLQYGIGLITNTPEASLDVLPNGSVNVFFLPAYRIPECYLTESWLGKDFLFASPHTPLNWSIREAQLSFAKAKQAQVI